MFDVGSKVIYERKLFQVMAYNGQKVVLLPLEHTGSVLVITPYYTQWRKA